MKKNIMMRVASVMLIAVLLSTCTISGTFAKYVTTESAGDAARVAKFGVEITASGSLFDETYIDNPDDGADITVKSEGAAGDISSTGIANVVAPGTKNTTGLTFNVSGTPEVDVKVVIDVNEMTLSDIFLAAGTYQDMTGYGPTYALADKYYPVVFTLTQTKGGATTTTTNLTMETLATTLEGLSAAKYDAGTNLADEIGKLTITWEWAFGDDFGITGKDFADTILGDLAAGLTVQKDTGTDGAPDTDLVSTVDYNLKTAIDITVTVTQIN